jgi:hypothetical protein
MKQLRRKVIHLGSQPVRIGIIEIDRATYVDRTYLSNWSRWRPADRGDHGAGVFLFPVCVVVVGWVVVRERGGESAVAPTVGRCSQQDSKNVHIRRIWYEKIDSKFPVGF